MICLVVDSNVLAAALIRKSTTRNLFLRADLELYLPDFSLGEIQKHKQTYMEKAGLNENEFDMVLRTALESFKVVALQEYEIFERQAKEISPDNTDWPFFALALQKNYPVWSNEKRLKKQSRVIVYSTEELLRLLMP